MSLDNSYLRIGIVGLGKQGRRHARLYWRPPRFVVSHYFDLNPRVEDSPQDGLESVPTLEAMLSPEKKIDLIIVATPPTDHFRIARKALEAGKHVVVDKPTCLQLQQTEGLIAFSQSHSRVLATFLNRRWDPDFRLLRQLIREADVGEIHSLESRVAEPYDGSSSYPGRSQWKLEPPGGGLLLDWGPHLFDQLFELMPHYRPKTLSCYSQRPNELVVVGLAEQFLIALEGDRLVALLGGTWNATLPPPRWYIVGRRGTIRVDGAATGARVRLSKGGRPVEFWVPAPPAKPDGFAEYFWQVLKRPRLQRAELQRMRRIAYALDLAERASREKQALAWEKPEGDLT